MKLMCFKNRRLLNRYVDGELSDTKISDLLSKHIDGCSHCRKELDYLLACKKIISTNKRVEVSSDFLVDLKEKLKPEPQIIKLKWVVDMGAWSKRLIPVPMAVMILLSAFMFSRRNNGVFLRGDTMSGLIDTEVSLGVEYVDSSSVVGTMLFGERGERK